MKDVDRERAHAGDSRTRGLYIRPENNGGSRREAGMDRIKSIIGGKLIWAICVLSRYSVYRFISLSAMSLK